MCGAMNFGLSDQGLLFPWRLWCSRMLSLAVSERLRVCRAATEVHTPSCTFASHSEPNSIDQNTWLGGAQSHGVASARRNSLVHTPAAPRDTFEGLLVRVRAASWRDSLSGYVPATRHEASSIPKGGTTKTPLHVFPNQRQGCRGGARAEVYSDKPRLRGTAVSISKNLVPKRNLTFKATLHGRGECFTKGRPLLVVAADGPAELVGLLKELSTCSISFSLMCKFREIDHISSDSADCCLSYYVIPFQLIHSYTSCGLPTGISPPKVPLPRAFRG